MPSHPVTVLEAPQIRLKGDRAALSLTLETLFDRYTKEGRHLPDGSLKTDLYLEHVRQTGRYLAQFFGRSQLVSTLTPDRVHDYVVWRRNGGVAGRRVGASTIQRDLGMFKAALNWACQKYEGGHPLLTRHALEKVRPALRERLAPGHDGEGKVVPNWDIPTLAGAGALRSTAQDMLTFLAANLDSTSAFRQAHVSRRAAGSPSMTIGLGWHILARPGGSITWHNGGTGGYRSFTGFDAARRVGVVVLTNANIGVDEIGAHLLDSTVPLPPLPRVRAAIQVDIRILDRYVRDYELTPAFHIVVTREGASLFIQATGQPKFPIYAESESAFFLKVVDAQITFSQDGMVLHQNGQNLPGKKIR